MALGLFGVTLSERRGILYPNQNDKHTLPGGWKIPGSAPRDSAKQSRSLMSEECKRLRRPAMFWSEFEKDAFRRNRNEQEKLLIHVTHMNIAQKIQGRFFNNDMTPYRVRGEYLEKLLQQYSAQKRKSLRAKHSEEQATSLVAPTTNDVYVLYIDDEHTEEFSDVTTYKTDGGLEYTLAYERPASSCANFAILQGREVSQAKEQKVASFLKSSKVPPTPELESLGHIDAFVHVVTKEALLNLPEFDTKQTKHVRLPERAIQSAQVGQRTDPARPVSRDDTGKLLRSKSAQPSSTRSKSAQPPVRMPDRNQSKVMEMEQDAHNNPSAPTSAYGTRPPTRLQSSRTSSFRKSPGLFSASSKPFSPLPPKPTETKHQLLRGNRYKAFLQLKRELRRKEEKRSLNLLRKMDMETQISIEKLKYQTCQINIEEFNNKIDKERKENEVADQLNLLTY